MDAALYLRISKDSERTGKGVARQRKECEALARKHGLNIVAEFEDNDISASGYSRRRRPAFEAMLARAEAGEFSTLLAWDVDRLIRKPEDGERLIELNGRSAFNLLTVYDSVDLRSPNGRLFLRIKVDVAAHEGELKSERIKASHRQRLDEGKPISGRTPFGWKIGGLELEPKEADAIRQATEELLAGGSVSAIQKQWNRTGLYGPSGKPWAVSSVKAVLRRWRNAGLLEHNGEVLEAHSRIEAIVSREDLEAVRQRLQLRPPRMGRPVTKSWLAGVMRCSVCGGKMLPRKDYYMCEVSTEGTRTDDTRHVAIAKHVAEERVRLALYFEANHRARWGTVEAVGVEKVREIEDALAEAQADRAEKTQLLFVKGVDKALVTAELARLADEIDRLEKERLTNRTASSEAARIASLMNADDTGVEFTGAWIEYFDSLEVEEKRELARTLDIEVQQGGKGAKRLKIQGEVEHFNLV